jgi:hypothetical protein
MNPQSTIRNPQSVALLATALLVAAIYFGSHRLTYFDPALIGYCLATVVACFATAYQVAAFWQRRAAAFYGWALVRSLRQPRQLLAAIRAAGRDLAAQRFIAPRGRLRWLAHMSLAWGTLAGFAVTLPLVWGWLHFEPVGDHEYRAVAFSLSTPQFATDGAIAWLVFHALDLAAVAVTLGAGYFLAARVRIRRHPGVGGGFHLAPLLLLLAVALSGLALPIAGDIGHRTFRLAALAHEATVIALLAALPYGKLIHLFIRPLHLGAQLVRASAAPVCCPRCGAAMAPAAQMHAIEDLLTTHGFHFAGHQQQCPPCRRKQLASVHTQLLGAHFQPQQMTRRLALEKAA